MRIPQMPLHLHFYAVAAWESLPASQGSTAKRLPLAATTPRLSVPVFSALPVRSLVLRALPLAFPLLLAATDFGSRLDHHGAYNFIAFILLSAPAIALVSVVTACAARLRLTRQRISAICIAGALFLVYWYASLRSLRRSWYTGIADQRMLESSEAIAAEQAEQYAAGGVSASDVEPRFTAASIRGGRSSAGSSSGPCSWD